MYVSRFCFPFLLAFDTASAELSLTGRVRTAGVTDAEKGRNSLSFDLVDYLTG